ncbi:MAG: MBL fold metallo-hydrolase [Luteitalea sp.]|nr:MBL fold metallo-hydrolase [Luteitalea sp.]
MTPRIHPYVSKEPMVRPNAFIVEAENELVIVDTTLTVSDSKALKEMAAGLHKPIVGILLTHGHPDHVAGTANIAPEGEVPICALRSVHDLMKASEQAKHEQWSAMFKEEWIPKWVYPNRIVKDGDTVHLAGLEFTVVDLGAGGDSDANSIWLLENNTLAAFVGDFIFNDHHTYMADGSVLRWIANLERFEPLMSKYKTIYVGHGPASDSSAIAGQKDYLAAACAHALEATGGTAVFTEGSRKKYEELMFARYPDYGFTFTVAFSADALAKELVGVAPV